MADRFLLKKFASETNDVGQFGSFQSTGGNIGDGVKTTDPDLIQSLPAWKAGWGNAVDNGLLLPRLEEMNGVQRVFAEMLWNQWRDGITFWQAGAPVKAMQSVVLYQTGDELPKLYINKTGVNGTNPPPQDTDNWVIFFEGAYNFVDTTSNQTISGTKTLTNPIAFKYKLPISRDEAPEANQSYRLVNFVDANDNIVGLLGFTKRASGEVSLRLDSRNNTLWSGIEIINSGTAGSSYINIGNPPDNVTGAEAITAYWAIKNLTYVSLPTAANMVPLTIGASGSQYTAPDNGWFAAWAYGKQANAAKLLNLTTGIGNVSTGQSSFSDGYAFVPVRKGETVKFSYTGSLLSNAYLRFYRGGTNNVIYS